MDPKQISAGLTCLSVELSPTAKATRAAPARAGSGYLLVLGKRNRPCGAGGPAWDLSGAEARWLDILKEPS